MQQLAPHNQSDASPVTQECLHQMFEEQVERTPDRAALRCGELSLSYTELNQRANRLAHLLRQRGVGPNEPVGLCVPRSAGMIVGLLGILKAGGCYLPLAVNDPAARILHQLLEARCRVLLTNQDQLGAFPQFGGEIVPLDSPLPEQSASNPPPSATPSDLIYVIYTSGSTGVPKGVATQHSNVVNYVRAIARQLALEQHPEGWHFATVSTICADLGNTSIFAALTSGGCLHVIDYETGMSPERFADYVARYPIDVLKIAPSQFAALFHGAGERNVLPRQWLIVGGEKLSWQLVEQIRARSGCAIMNHYGPTETTIGCCTFVVDESCLSKWGPVTVPLGRPIANDRVYILDPYLQPVPAGEPGELCMSGAGLSRGYLNQPQLTAERFVPHPFSGEPGARLYRTGDLARFLPDGNIEFLGRIDQQVKIRGFRVEPAEVESALRSYPGIRQAVVLADEDSNGATSLAAFMVASPPPITSDLRAHLSSRVPDYMVPSRVVAVDAIPLTANGKADARALLARGGEDRKPTSAAPRNSDEEALVAIWCEVLKVDRLGVHDNFFELGGHSLLAMQIISRIRSRFGVQLPVQSFLLGPTIAEVAANIRQCSSAAREDEEIDRILGELDAMSEEEAAEFLAAQLASPHHRA